MGRNIVPRADGDSSLGTASKEYAAIYAKELGGTLADKIAPLDSPVFRGVPSAPTAEPGTNTTQLATTAYTYEALERHNDSISAHPAMRAEITEEINEAVSRAAFDPMGDLSQTYATKTALATTKTELEEKITTTTNSAVTNHNNSLAAHQNVIKRHNEDENAHADIRALIAAGGGGGGSNNKITRFLTSGAYTVPDGITKLYVSGCAGGAGGGIGSGGGGGQSVMRKEVSVTPGENIIVVIGTGGAGYWNMPTTSTGAYSDYSNIPCRAGGNTTFGTYFTLTGGKAAAKPSSADPIKGCPVSKAGGPGATNGGHFHQIYENIFEGGRGGDSLFGRGGSGGVPVLNSATSLQEATQATSGIGYGSGGGGCGWYVGSGIMGYTDAGDGANGIIIIETE